MRLKRLKLVVVLLLLSWGLAALYIYLLGVRFTIVMLLFAIFLAE